jgi:hypothetical protein
LALDCRYVVGTYFLMAAASPKQLVMVHGRLSWPEAALEMAGLRFSRHLVEVLVMRLLWRQAKNSEPELESKQKSISRTD